MNRLRGAGLASLLGAALLLGPGFAQAPEQDKGSVVLRVISYDGLGQEVLKHRGKVVVLDMWQFL